jgi:hypothetical protein
MSNLDDTIKIQLSELIAIHGIEAWYDFQERFEIFDYTGKAYDKIINDFQKFVKMKAFL